MAEKGRDSARGSSHRRKGAGRASRNRALVLGGLLLFGTIFGGASLALHSGKLFPIEYPQGAFVYTSSYLGTGSGNELVVFTADRQNEPLPNQPVTVTLNNGSGSIPIFAGKTDVNGMLAADLRVPEQSNAVKAVTLVIRAGKEVISKDLPFYAQSSYLGGFRSTATTSSGSGGKNASQPPASVPPKLYLTMDKPLYQPGQAMHLRTLSFWEGETNTGNVTYEVQDPSGNKLFRTTLDANKWGITSLDYPLANILPLGSYTITAKSAGATASRTVKIDRYVLPKFPVKFTGLKEWYTFTDSINGSLEANYFFGKPVNGEARINATLPNAYYGHRDDLVFNKTLPVTDGKCSFNISATRSYIHYTNYYYNLRISAEVTDTGGHVEKAETTVILTNDRHYFTVLLETATPGQDLTTTVLVRDVVDKPVKGALVKAQALEPATAILEGVSDERGFASFSFKYTFNEKMTFTVTSPDGKGSTSQTCYLGGPSAVKLVPDKKFYEAGETARVKVYADPADDFAGVAKLAAAEVKVSGVPVARQGLTFENAQASFSFKVTSDMVPTMELEVRKLSALNYSGYWENLYGDYYHRESGGYLPRSQYFADRYMMAQDRVAVAVGIRSQLNVTVAASQERLKPGEEVELLLGTFDGDGPVSAALAVAIVDEALLALGGGSAFDEIREDLLKDPGYEQYSIYAYMWGARRPLPSFQMTTHYDYKAPSGVLEYSSTEMFQGGVRIKANPAALGGFAAAVAALGVLGYFGVLALGMYFKKTAVALVASFLMLVAVVPAVLEVSNEPKVVEFGDPTEPLTFSQPTISGTDYNTYDRYKGGFFPRPSPPPLAFGSRLVFNGGGVNSIDDGEGFGDNTSRDQSAPGLVFAPSRSVSVRSWFPELWYWNPLVVTDEEGRGRLTLRAPDSITTWNIDTVASTLDGRIGVGEGNITVFQPFFVDPDLPASVVRNDRFTFNVQIYNYESSDKWVKVDLEGADWFTILGESSLRTLAPSASVSSVSFTIQALKVGVQGLQVSGTADTHQDIVTKELLVEPDGKLVEDIRNGLLENSTRAELSFTLDPRRIVGSEVAYIKLQSGLQSVIIDGADNFVTVVSGCGEQSTSRLSVDVLAYENYLKGKANPDNLTRCRQVINAGIQHEAQYLSSHTGGHGRAIVWHAGEDPDLWLTAWAIQAYASLQVHGFLADDRIIPDLQTYLTSAQALDGTWTFPDVGHWSINSELKNGKLATTAYITRALLISGMAPSSIAVTRGVAHIESAVAGADDSFTRALCLDALGLAGRTGSVRDSLVQKLVSSAVAGSSGAVHWKYGPDSQQSWRGDNSIETTGYAVMALARAGHTGLASAGAKHLVLARGAGGFYGSTHNTAVAFTALNSLGEITPMKRMGVDVRVEGELAATADFTAENGDLTYLTDLGKWFRSTEGPAARRLVTVTVSTTGEGSVFYHVYTKQNLDWALINNTLPAELSFSISYGATAVRVGQVISARGEVSYTGQAPAVQMVLVELRAPAGFVLDESDIAALEAKKVVSFHEMRGRTGALLYLDSLKKGEVRYLGFSLVALSPASSLLQHVNAFDMYNISLRAELSPVAFTSTL